MHVRTQIHAGECAGCAAEQLMESAQDLMSQVDATQLAGMAGQFGLQVDPQQLQPLLQMAQGVTLPDQFMAMVGQ